MCRTLLRYFVSPDQLSTSDSLDARRPWQPARRVTRPVDQQELVRVAATRPADLADLANEEVDER